MWYDQLIPGPDEFKSVRSVAHAVAWLSNAVATCIQRITLRYESLVEIPVLRRSGR